MYVTAFGVWRFLISVARHQQARYVGSFIFNEGKNRASRDTLSLQIYIYTDNVLYKNENSRGSSPTSIFRASLADHDHGRRTDHTHKIIIIIIIFFKYCRLLLCTHNQLQIILSLEGAVESHSAGVAHLIARSFVYRNA